MPIRVGVVDKGGEAKVAQLGVTQRVDEHIGVLDVAVQHTDLVAVLDRADELLEHIRGESSTCVVSTECTEYVLCTTAYGREMRACEKAAVCSVRVRADRTASHARALEKAKHGTELVKEQNSKCREATCTSAGKGKAKARPDAHTIPE